MSFGQSPSPRILYGDCDYAVVIKNIGEICQDTPIEQGNCGLVNIVKPLLEKKLNRPVSFCQCVNRLDRPVSGLCVLALNKKAFSKFSDLFASGKVNKTYLAITEKPDNKQDLLPNLGIVTRLTGSIVFDRKKQKAFMVSKNSGKSKSATLDYVQLGQGERYLFLKVNLLTGRTHQIRCQLSNQGLKIKGDVKYGAKRSEANGGIRLHAWGLSFIHPDTDCLVEYWAEPPVLDNLWQICMGLATGQSYEQKK